MDPPASSSYWDPIFPDLQQLVAVSDLGAFGVGLRGSEVIVLVEAEVTDIGLSRHISRHIIHAIRISSIYNPYISSTYIYMYMYMYVCIYIYNPYIIQCNSINIWLTKIRWNNFWEMNFEHVLHDESLDMDFYLTVWPYFFGHRGFWNRPSGTYGYPSLG